MNHNCKFKKRVETFSSDFKSCGEANLQKASAKIELWPD